MKTEKSIWVRICERCIPARTGIKTAPIEFPSLDVERNDKTLETLRDDDPVHTAWMSYAQTHIENNLRQAFNVALTPEQQMDFKNRAGAVVALVEDIETTRQRLKADLIERQKQAERRKK